VDNGRKGRHVRKRGFLVALVVVVTIIMVYGGPALAGKPGRGTVLEANLTGTGDTDGTGYFHATAYPAKNKICYRISASNIGTATAAHLHVDDAEDSVKLNLKTPPQDGSSVRECRRGLSERSVRTIKNNPANYYVDVHTEDFPDGAVRGQLTRPAPSP
jgi:hypothetical protein